MTLPSEILEAVSNAVAKIKGQIQTDIETHSNELGSSSSTGHTKAGGAPQDINTTGTSSAGTDNGYYARADHVHKIATASTSSKGIVQLDNTPTTNSTNAITSGAVQSALSTMETGTGTTISSSINTHNTDSSAHSTAMNLKADKANGANQITDTTSTFSNLGTLTDYKQSTINQAIDDALGTTSGLVQTITDGDTTHSPSADAVHDYVDDYIGDINDFIDSNIDNVLTSEVIDSVTDGSLRPVTSNAVYDALGNKVDKENGKGLFSGSYSDLTNKPTIPSDVSDLTDISNTTFTPKSHTHIKSQITDFPTLSTVATSGSYNDLSNKPTIPDVVTVDSSLSSSSTNPVQNKVINTALNGKADSSHNQASSTITDSNTYSNIGNTASTLDNILSNINTKLGSIANIELVEVTSNKGTASASTMNKLYLVPQSGGSGTDNYEIFVTVKTGTSGNYSYAWERIDSVSIDLSNYLTTSNASSTYLSKTDASSTYVAKSQGSGNSGKFLKVNSSGNVALESVTIPNAYTHPNSGVTAGTNYSSNQTPSFNSTFNIPKITFDAQGHITASSTSTVKIPALPTGDTSTAGILQLGTTSSTAAAGNHTHSEYLTSSNLSEHISLSYDDSTGLLTLNFN